MTSLILNMPLVSNVFVARFLEGGPLFMTLILICFLLSFFFLIRAFLSLKKDIVISRKMTEFASETSVLGLVLGFFGSVIGMITAFDVISSWTSVDPIVLAAGLKVSFITTAFGCVTFVLPRIGIVVLKILQK